MEIEIRLVSRIMEFMVCTVYLRVWFVTRNTLYLHWTLHYKCMSIVYIYVMISAYMMWAHIIWLLVNIHSVQEFPIVIDKINRGIYVTNKMESERCVRKVFININKIDWVFFCPHVQSSLFMYSVAHISMDQARKLQSQIQRMLKWKFICHFSHRVIFACIGCSNEFDSVLE